jgi:Flp pilus assembly protein TadD
MSRSLAVLATVLALAGPVAAQTPPADAPVAAPTPASPARRAEMERADALTRSVFWRGELAANPADAEAALRLAAALTDLGQAEQAAAVAEAALTARPDDRALLMAAGRAHIARGQAFYGIAALERARDLDPADWRAWSLLGVAYQQVRRSADAEAAWAEGLRLSPEQPALLANIAMARLTAGDAAAAEALLRRAAARPDAGLKVHQNLALVLGLQGKAAEAEALLRRNLPPDQADANLAWLQARAAAPAPAGGRTWDSLRP